MPSYTVIIPKDLHAGIVAIACLESKTTTQIVSEYAISAATKACQDLQVGPFYVGPVLPRFNAEGLPYVANDEPPASVTGEDGQ